MQDKTFFQIDLPDGQSRRTPVQPFRKKYFASVFRKFMIIVTSSRLDEEGRMRIVTTREAGCDGREPRTGRMRELRTAKSCGPGTPGLVLSLRVVTRRRR